MQHCIQRQDTLLSYHRVGFWSSFLHGIYLVLVLPPALHLSSLSCLVPPSDNCTSSSFIPHSQLLHLFDQLLWILLCPLTILLFPRPRQLTTLLQYVIGCDAIHRRSRVDVGESTTHTAQYLFSMSTSQNLTTFWYNAWLPALHTLHFSSAVQCDAVKCCLYKSDWIVVLRGIRSFCNLNLIFLMKSTIQIEYRTCFLFSPSLLSWWHANTQIGRQTDK